MSSSPAAAAASPSRVETKKAQRRRARGAAAAAKPRSFHVYIEDMLKRSPRLSKIQTLNGSASAFVGSSVHLLAGVLLRRADAVRKHRGHSGFQPKDMEVAVRSFFAHATPATREKLSEMIEAAYAAVAAVAASRAEKQSE